MSKTLFLMASLALAGCAPTTEADETTQVSPPIAQTEPAPPATTEQDCDAAPAQYAIGQKISDALGAKLLTQTGARILRVIPPDTAVTMDYSSSRLNISHDKAKVITSITCG